MTVELKPRIVVIGVGGAGGNAVNNMIDANLQGVEFIVANTDAQALSRSSAPVKLQLGAARTAGLGAGANPEVGAESAKESHEDIKKILQGAHMCFIAAGMGGGTGTGAAPIIARIAKEQKVLTVGVVTKPFDFEGKRRMQVAEKGIVDLRAEVDTLIIIPNQNLFRVASRDTTFAQAFAMADGVLYSGVRGITDLMVMPGLINLDFADVRTVMAGMGTAMMGQGEAEGENRALKAAQAAISNPLLDDVSLKGAKGVIINITGGYDMTLFEVDEAANEIRREVDIDGHIILGSTFDENMAGKIRVSVVAAGIAQGVSVQPAAPVQIQGPRPTVRDILLDAAAPLAGPQPAPAYQPAAQQPVGQQPVVAQPAEPSPLFPPAGVRIAPVIRRPGVSEYQGVAVEPDELDLVTPLQPAYTAPAAPAPAPAAQAVAPVAAQPAAPHPAPEQPAAGKSFAGLFGWKKAAPEAAAPAPQPVEEDKFDDELEIPAFLRRSANN